MYLLKKLTYQKVYNKKLQYKNSKFWEALGFPTVLKSKFIRYIILWDMPWRADCVVINEIVASILFVLAVIQFGYERLFKLPGSENAFLQVRMLQILRNNFLLGKTYRALQDSIQTEDWENSECESCESDLSVA